MHANLIPTLGYRGLLYLGLAAIPLIILGHYLGVLLAPLAKKLTAKLKLVWLRWQKRGQFAHYTKETLERYAFGELYDVVKASLAVADYRTAEHILIHLLARPEAGQQPDLHQLLGQIYRHYGNLSKAKLVCQQGIRAYPQFYDTYPLLGQILYDNHDYGAAIHLLQEAIMLDPRRPEAYQLVTGIHVKQRRPQEALALLNRGLDEQPKSLPLLQAKLAILQKESSPATTLELAELILASYPHDPATQKIRSQLQKKLAGKQR